MSPIKLVELCASLLKLVCYLSSDFPLSLNEVVELNTKLLKAQACADRDLDGDTAYERELHDTIQGLRLARPPCGTSGVIYNDVAASQTTK